MNDCYVPTSEANEVYHRDLLEKGYALFALPDEVEGGIQAVYALAEDFFRLAPDLKERAELPFGCGHMPFGQEHSGDPERPDHAEIFIASARTAPLAEALDIVPARLLHAAMMRVFDAIEPLAEDLVRHIAAELYSGSAERLRGGLRRWSQLQLNRALPTEPDVLVNMPHEDGHVLTFAHATAPGLELSIASEFVPIGRPPKRVVLMPGSALTLLTGGQIPPLHHQVRAHLSESPRLSLMFFADLDPNLCQAWRSDACNEGVDVGAHVLANSPRFGVPGFTRE
jgi:isopenicillin N synthase-like dioxygenase